MFTGVTGSRGAGRVFRFPHLTSSDADRKAKVHGPQIIQHTQSVALNSSLAADLLRIPAIQDYCALKLFLL